MAPPRVVSSEVSVGGVFGTPGEEQMERYQMNSCQFRYRKVVAAGLATLLLAMAFSIALGSGAALADESPQAAVEWNEAFGGEMNDKFYSVQQTSDGGYIVAGVNESERGGDADVFLIKTDSQGRVGEDQNIITFKKTFDNSHHDEGRSVVETGLVGNADGYIVVGSTYSDVSGGVDVWLIRTDEDGNVIWEECFGGAAVDRGYSVQQTSDGGYIVVGETYSADLGGGVGNAGFGDAYLIKVDSNGGLEWQKTFGGESLDIGYSVQQTLDGGYVLAGQTYSAGHGSSDVYVVKTDSLGDEVWAKRYGGKDVDVGYSVQQTEDGYIVVGATYSEGAGDYDVYLVKTDSAGFRQWEQTFGGSEPDWGYSVQQTSDNGYIIAGSTQSYGSGSKDLWLVKTDAGGIEQWNKAIGGTGSDIARCVDQALDGGYIIAGENGSLGSGEIYAWLTRVSNPPHRPSNQSPSDGAVDQSLTTQLVSSEFSDPDGGDKHEASQWQITTAPGDYSDPVYDSGTDTVSETSRPIPPGTLNYDTIYYWRVRYQDDHYAWSSYSTETSFSTSTMRPDNPTNVSPVDNSTDVSTTPLLKSSQFHDPEIEDIQEASHWQITRTRADYSTPVFEAVLARGTAMVLNSVQVPLDRLEYEVTYYWRVRHQDSDGNWSEWSDETSFTTAVTPPPPVAAFSAASRSGNAPFNVEFVDTSTGEIVSWAWDFNNDGNVDNTEQNPWITYSAGTYTVSLTVTGPGGASDTETKLDYITASGGGGLGSCACASASAAPSPSSLIIGWSMAGLTWGTGYCLVRRAGRRKRG
jgi:PKD repeat protein